jgi:hypothetical protein
MNSVRFPQAQVHEAKPLDQRATPLPSKSHTRAPVRGLRIPVIALKIDKIERILALRRSKKKSSNSPSLVKKELKDTKFSHNLKVDGARAGPSNEMNVIDLTADNVDDDQAPKYYVSSEDDMYDDDPSDEDVFYPAPERKQQANIGPKVNGYAAPQVVHRAAPQQPPARPVPVPNRQGNPFGAHDVWEDFVLDDDFDDENITRAYAQFDQPHAPQAPASRPHAEPIANVQPQTPAREPVPEIETKDECVVATLGLFPDICPDYVSELFDKVSRSSDRLIAHVLDEMEKGSPYPKAKDKQKTLKRKREVDEDEAAKLKYGAPGRAAPLDADIRAYV